MKCTSNKNISSLLELLKRVVRVLYNHYQHHKTLSCPKGWFPECPFAIHRLQKYTHTHKHGSEGSFTGGDGSNCLESGVKQKGWNHRIAEEGTLKLSAWMKDIHQWLLSGNELLAYRCLKGYLANGINITAFWYKLYLGSQQPNNGSKKNGAMEQVQTFYCNSLQLSIITQATSDRIAKTKQTSVRWIHLWGEANSLLSLRRQCSLCWSCRPPCYGFWRGNCTRCGQLSSDGRQAPAVVGGGLNMFAALSLQLVPSSKWQHLTFSIIGH